MQLGHHVCYSDLGSVNGMYYMCKVLSLQNDRSIVAVEASLLYDGITCSFQSSSVTDSDTASE